MQHTTIETHTATAQAGSHLWGDPISARSVPLQQPGLIAKTFHVPMEKVRLTVTEIGGGFGGTAATNIGWKDLPDHWTDKEENLCGRHRLASTNSPVPPPPTSVLVR